MQINVETYMLVISCSFSISHTNTHFLLVLMMFSLNFSRTKKFSLLTRQHNCQIILQTLQYATDIQPHKHLHLHAKQKADQSLIMKL